MKCFNIQSGVTANLQYNIRQIFKCKNISKKEITTIDYTY